MVADVVLYPISESAITIQFESVINPDTLRKVLAYQEALLAHPFEGFIETVSAYNTLAVYFNPRVVMQSKLTGNSLFEKVANYIQSLPILPKASSANRIVEVPVCYDGAYALDLVELSQTLKLSTAEIIQRHTATIYTVFMVGFTPGFPYLGELDELLQCGRKASPRKKVPAGSVGLAGKQTGIYPFETPGGWQIIGRTPIKLFDVMNSHCSLLQAGMQVKFVSISPSEFKTLSQP